MPGINKFADKLGVGQLAGLFACMVAGRSWGSIEKGIDRNKQSSAEVRILQDVCAINDPLSQTQSPASSDLYSHLNFVLFIEILKNGDRCTDTTCENSDHY